MGDWATVSLKRQQVKGYYLNQRWPSLLTHISITLLQGVNNKMGVLLIKSIIEICFCNTPLFTPIVYTLWPNESGHHLAGNIFISFLWWFVIWSNFAAFRSHWFKQQYSCIGIYDGSAPDKRRSNIRTNAGWFCWYLYASLGLDISYKFYSICPLPKFFETVRSQKYTYPWRDFNATLFSQTHL